MLIAALVVGLLTAYYFGYRPAMAAAGATAALFLVAAVAPALALWAYLAVGLGVVGLMWLGPRLRSDASRSRQAFAARAGAAQLRRALAQLRARRSAPRR